MTVAARLLDAVVPLVRTRLPAGVDIAYLDDFVVRNRWALEAVITQNLGPMLARIEAANNAAFPVEDIPEFWTASKRTAANVAAMATAANLYAQKRGPNAEERAVLAGYSGWGGLSIQAAAGRFPAGFPAPEERGLIHQRVRSRNLRSHAERGDGRPSRSAASAREGCRLRRCRTAGLRRRARGSRPHASRCR